jgi:LmbE family N-acetylglucosaminyl deacetylase
VNNDVPVATVDCVNAGGGRGGLFPRWVFMRVPTSRRVRGTVFGVAVTVAAVLASVGRAAETKESAAILQEMRRLGEMGSVLYVAAHPDDENTQLITYLARGRGYRTAYLSLTRGDGGQNVIGGEFGEQLGLIRTHELLEARKLDGGRQFFSRAIDFGFSKDYQETLTTWDRREVLGDVVRVIRTFRPDVVVTRFSPEPGGTHGHHTASAVLAVEAFKLAGDASAFPEQLKTLTPWQPKRILQNGRGSGDLQMDVSGTDGVTGETFARIAGRSRGMHKSQGFGNYAGSDRAARPETFQLLGGEAATKDIMDGVDTTWGRVAEGAEIAGAIEGIVKGFNGEEPAASVPALLELRGRLAKLGGEPLVTEKRRDLDRIIQACLGLSVETTVAEAEVVPGETVRLHHAVGIRSGHAVKWVGVRSGQGSAGRLREAVVLRAGEPAKWEETVTLPADMPLTQPYWLREDGADGISRVDDAELIGMPENPPALPVEYVFEVGGQELVVHGEPVAGPTRRRLEVIPPVSLRATSAVRLFGPGESREVRVEVRAARANMAGVVKLDAPSGWKVEPASRPFKLEEVGGQATVAFNVTAPAKAGTAVLTAAAEVKGAHYRTGRVEIQYAHIPPLLLQPPARVKVVSVELATRGKRVGYLPGAGDSVAEGIEEMGYEVVRLQGADLTAERLGAFDAVVVGVRAFNVRTDLGEGAAALFKYAEGGGTVIVQYNRPDGIKARGVAPFDLKIGGGRVTDERAAMTLLAPEHPALNVPNKIGPGDFEGWVQERGLYYPGEWDGRFTPLLAAADPGSDPLKGGLLVAPHGEGYFVYTGLAFFRQLPAGVPGAYRLFANLVSLGN